MSGIRGIAGWLPARLRAAGRGLVRLAMALVGTLRDGARRESRRRRIFWGVLAALLVLGPLVFNLARVGDHKASVLLFTREVDPYQPVTDPDYYRAFLGDPVLRQQMRLNVDAAADEYDGVTIRRASRPLVMEVTVAAGTPRRAQRLVNALAAQLAFADQRRLAGAADRDARRVRERLRSRPPLEQRSRLRRALRRLDGFGPFPPPRVLPGARAPVPRLERWADRLVDDLPGDYRSRPNPAWAALSGLLVVATLWAIALVLLPPARRAEADAPAPESDAPAPAA